MGRFKHVDKYANLRQTPSDRGHYNRDGTPKRALTKEVAEGTVIWVYESQGDVVHPYQCGLCNGWHVGKRPPNWREEGVG